MSPSYLVHNQTIRLFLFILTIQRFMEQHVVISFFFWTKFYFCVNLFEAMLAQNIYWTSIVSIYFTLNKSNVCECPKFHSLFMSVSFALIVCTAPSVHKHTYSHAFCFPFVCAVIRALCAMGASFHAKYTFQIVVCLCCLSIFFERWRVCDQVHIIYTQTHKMLSTYYIPLFRRIGFYFAF